MAIKKHNNTKHNCHHRTSSTSWNLHKLIKNISFQFHFMAVIGVAATVWNAWNFFFASLMDISIEREMLNAWGPRRVKLQTISSASQLSFVWKTQSRFSLRRDSSGRRCNYGLFIEFTANFFLHFIKTRYQRSEAVIFSCNHRSAMAF